MCEIGYMGSREHQYTFVEFPANSSLTRYQIDRFIELFRNSMDPQFLQYCDFSETYSGDSIRAINQSQGFYFVLDGRTGIFLTFFNCLRNTCNQIYEIVSSEYFGA